MRGHFVFAVGVSGEAILPLVDPVGVSLPLPSGEGRSEGEGETKSQHFALVTAGVAQPRPRCRFSWRPLSTSRCQAKPSPRSRNVSASEHPGRRQAARGIHCERIDPVTTVSRDERPLPSEEDRLPFAQEKHASGSGPHAAGHRLGSHRFDVARAGSGSSPGERALPYERNVTFRVRARGLLRAVPYEHGAEHRLGVHCRRRRAITPGHDCDVTRRASERRPPSAFHVDARPNGVHHVHGRRPGRTTSLRFSAGCASSTPRRTDTSSRSLPARGTRSARPGSSSARSVPRPAPPRTPAAG